QHGQESTFKFSSSLALIQRDYFIYLGNDGCDSVILQKFLSVFSNHAGRVSNHSKKVLVNTNVKHFIFFFPKVIHHLFPMTRSTFLKKLLGSLVIGKLPVSLTKDFRKIYLLQCFVAGLRFYEGMQKLHEMKEGDLLELIREPENEHDTCAIALHWRGSKIGFIPADMNEMLSMLMDADA